MFNKLVIGTQNSSKEFIKNLLKAGQELVIEIDRTKPNSLDVLRSLGQVEMLEWMCNQINTFLENEDA